MAGNIWSAGIDTFDNILAEREQKRILGEDRARRDALDAENRDYRQSQMDLQRQQQARVEKQDYERSLENRLDKDRETEKKEKITRLWEIAADESQSQQIRNQAGAALLAEGVAGGTVNATLERGGPKKMKPVYRMGRNGKLEKTGEVEEGSSVYQEPAPVRGPQEPVSHRDDPSLPQGVKNWISSFAGSIPLDPTEDVADGAMNRLRAGWAQQQAAHPRADLGEALKYMRSFYGQGGDQTFQPPMTPAAPAPAGPPGPPAASAVPAQSLPVMPPAGGNASFFQRSTPPPASVGRGTPPPTAAPQGGGPAQAEIDNAIAALRDAGAAVTEANIAAAIQQLRGQ